MRFNLSILLVAITAVSAIPSKRSQPTAWMQANIGTLGSRPLKHIAIPGSHDAGMYTLNGGTAFSDSANTQTQTLTVGQQLNAGSRYFDIRPVISDGQFVTGHYSDVTQIKSWQGSNGESMANIINDINSFTNSNQELVIINLSHAYDTDLGNSNYPALTQDQWNSLFQQMTGINHLFVAQNPSSVDLTTQTLNTFIGNGAAAVLVIVQPDNSISLGDFANKGFYNYGQLNAYNNYADTDSLSGMENDQLNKMASQRSNPDASYFLLSWTLTQNTAETLGFGSSILKLASQANSALYSALPPKLSKNTYPNIIMVDNFAADGKIVDLVMTINSQFAS